MDRGVEFAIQNLEKALSVAKADPKYQHLIRVIQIELRRVSSISKTGDLIRYYEQFASKTHPHALDFELLSEAANNEFIPSEGMSEYLRNAFPFEKESVTKIDDFVFEHTYSNDFLSVVLGGSYALSFRRCRYFSNYAYIVMNPFITKANAWLENGMALWYSLPKRCISKESSVEPFVERYHDFSILVFEKEGNGEFGFAGIFKIDPDQKDEDKILLRRQHPDSSKIWKVKAEQAEPLPRFGEKDIFSVLTDVLLQRAMREGTKFEIKVTKNKASEKRNYEVNFPFGFYELFETYEPQIVFIGPNPRVRDKNAKNVTVFSDKRDGSEGYARVVDLLPNESEYVPEYYYKLLQLEPEQKISSPNGPFATSSLDREEPAILESMVGHFLFEAFQEDLNLEGNGSTVLKEYPLGRGQVVDIAIQGPYDRLGIDSPLFEIKERFNKDSIVDRASHFSPDLRRRLVFIVLGETKTFQLEADEGNCLVLGQAFLNSLSLRHPECALAYLPLDYKEDKEENVLLPEKDENLLFQGAMKLSEERLVSLAMADKKVSIILGNGVSIPYGSEPWNEMTTGLAKQLEPLHIESVKDVDDFFGKLSFSVNDFTKDSLFDLGLDDLYWRQLWHSIYRRFHPTLFEMESAIKSIAMAKHQKGQSLQLFTYNYDDFLELTYKYLYPAETLPSLSEKQCDDVGAKKGVVHIHGLYAHDKTRSQLILTRDEYFNAYEKKKTNVEPISCLERALDNTTCLFVGSSMTDIFQMNVIRKHNEKRQSKRIYALLRLAELKEKEQVAVYKYFLRKGVIVLPFDKYEDLPGIIKTLFSVKTPDSN